MAGISGRRVAVDWRVVVDEIDLSEWGFHVTINDEKDQVDASGFGGKRTFLQGDRRLEVLRGVTIDLKAGEIVALVGQSGSGKSTLLHIAGLLERPDEGDIVVDGKSAGTAGDRERTVMRRKRTWLSINEESVSLRNVATVNITTGIKRGHSSSSRFLWTVRKALRSKRKPRR